MNIVRKMVLLGEIIKDIEEVYCADRHGICLYAEDFSRILGTDNSKFEIENWDGKDNMSYCMKTICLDDIKIYAIFDKNNRDYRVATKKAFKPFRPKNNEKYWTYYLKNLVNNDSEWKCVWSIWNDKVTDYMCLRIGICFRTEKEALENRPRFYKELTGKEWQGEQNV